MSAWPRLTAPVDPIATRDLYQWQSANTRNGVVPPPEEYAIARWKLQHLSQRFEDRVAAQVYAEDARADAMPADPGYMGGV